MKRFGRVFLIRAKGRSGEEILQALTQRRPTTRRKRLRARWRSYVKLRYYD